jgi:uncharacterized protein
VQISDIHAGSFDNAIRLQRGIDLIKAQNADLFVFTGDLVNNSASEFDTWKSYFMGITAPLGQYSVMGNHDYGDYSARPTAEAKEADIALLHRHHADIGRHLLCNEHVILQKDEESIVLAGVENRGDGFSRHGDLDKALA